jgi:hypothetical protein
VEYRAMAAIQSKLSVLSDRPREGGEDLADAGRSFPLEGELERFAEESRRAGEQPSRRAGEQLTQEIDDLRKERDSVGREAFVRTREFGWVLAIGG